MSEGDLVARVRSGDAEAASELVLRHGGRMLAVAPRILHNEEGHLEVCPDCVNYLDSYRQTVRIAKEAFAQEEDAVTAGVPEELVTAVLRARVPGS